HSIVEACSATQQRTEADHQNVDQLIALGAIAPGIGQSATVGDQVDDLKKAIAGYQPFLKLTQAYADEVIRCRRIVGKAKSKNLDSAALKVFD
ncbi:MAG: hypothetical protein WCS94_23735, partial [Verrucomicrobiota bacterium]